MRSKFFLFCVLSPLIYAATAVAAANGSHWQILIHSLQSKGVERIGDFNLETFRQRALTVPFLPLDQAPPSVIAGSRGSAYYLTAQRRIYILPRQSEADLAALPQLEVHELLGALGYGDADTSKSTALVAIDGSTNEYERAQLIANYGSTIFRKGRLRMAGGFSVGGGGDLAIINAKSEVLRYVQNLSVRSASTASSDFFRKFPAINFEPLRHGNEVVLSYKYRYGAGNGVKENISVFVPTSVWSAGENSRQVLVQEIAAKLLSIFPAGSRSPGRTFTPTACERGEQITFPEPNDLQISVIQNERGGVLLGCGRIAHVTGGESVVGPVGESMEPNRPGYYRFSCVLSSPAMNGPFRFTLQSPALGRGPTTYAASVFDGDSINMGLEVTGRGRILRARIAYQETSASPLSPTVQSTSNGDHASTSVRTRRGILALTCAGEP